MNKLNVVIMGQNCEKFIGMCLESVKKADVIVYCDGGSIDNTLNIINICTPLKINTEPEKIVKIQKKWNPEKKGINGKQFRDNRLGSRGTLHVLWNHNSLETTFPNSRRQRRVL